MMLKRLLAALPVLFCMNAHSQDAITQVEAGNDMNVLYRNEMSGGIIFHSNGWGINYRRGWHVTAAKKRIFELEMVSMKHPKEIKVVNRNFENSKGFFYGKQYAVSVLRAGYGYQNTLFRRAERKSIEIRYCTFVGASIGLAKPVYVDILHATKNKDLYDITTERYDPATDSIQNIYGRAPYLKGIEEMRFYPGGFAKLGLSFEYADRRNDIKTIETGIVFDLYPKAIPVMAFTQNNPYFLCLYLSFNYGKRWF